MVLLIGCAELFLESALRAPGVRKPTPGSPVFWLFLGSNITVDCLESCVTKDLFCCYDFGFVILSPDSSKVTPADVDLPDIDRLDLFVSKAMLLRADREMSSCSFAAKFDS